MVCPKEKEILLHVIEIYQSMPHLWQQNHKDYLNKVMRSSAFKELLDIYKNFDRDATQKVLKKRIDNMRVNYAKELKKVIASKQRGSDAGGVYKPSLWYYKAMSFLKSHYSTTTTEDPLQNEESNFSSSEEENDLGQRSTSIASSSGYLQMKQSRDILLLKQENDTNSDEQLMTSTEDECEVYGRTIGLQMKELNKRQSIIAQKLMSDVMFYGKLGRLTDFSCVDIRAPNEDKPKASQRQRERYYRCQSPLSQKPFYSSYISTLSPYSPSPPHQVRSPSPNDHLSPHSSPSHNKNNQDQLVDQPPLSPQDQFQAPFALQSSEHRIQSPHQPSSALQNHPSLSLRHQDQLSHQPSLSKPNKIKSNHVPHNRHNMKSFHRVIHHHHYHHHHTDTRRRTLRHRN